MPPAKTGSKNGAQLKTDNLSLAYEQLVVVEGLSLQIQTGKITTFVGANGSGKSTILKGLARILKPKMGAVYLDGKAIHRIPTKQVAQRLAMLPQSPQAPDGLTVRELVSYGRYPYQGGFGILQKQDQEIIRWALEITGMADLDKRPVGTLSGGQRQRAWIAMALCQDTPLLLLDEPTTFLDMAYQLEVLQLLHKLNQEENRTIVMVLHDLNQAARYSDYLFAISGGKVVAQGAPEEVITPEILRQVFGVEALVVKDPRYGTPLCIPYEVMERQPV
ncbi:MAG: ABC transporter ATP-binding protein [Anaerolineae bacterium]|nr:ABC transporter ATP-binding protein [Anaerolineae bacterium]